jgi:hypothetical protein
VILPGVVAHTGHAAMMLSNAWPHESNAHSPRMAGHQHGGAEGMAERAALASTARSGMKH